MNSTDHAHAFGEGQACPCGADVYAVATGAWAGGNEPRAQTAEEIRDRFMNTVRAAVDSWASDSVQRDTVHERLSGLAHSLLCMIDGSNMGLPAFDLVASPHPDDKAYHQGEGENWIEPGTVINDGDCLHELLYDRGIWAGRHPLAPGPGEGSAP